MTHSPNPQPLALTRLLPKILAGTALAFVGYTGIFLGVNYYLPPWLEKQVSHTLNRQVKLGKLKNFSLTKIEFGTSSMIAESNQPNHFIVQKITIQFNPLPVLYQRTLPVEITLTDVEGLIRQDKQKDWLKVNIREVDLPVYQDISINLENANINLLPQNQKIPLKVKLNGVGKYTNRNQDRWHYNFNMALLDSTINVKGETLTRTTESHIELAVGQLSLKLLNYLLADRDRFIDSGHLNANLKLDFPSLKTFSQTQGLGKVNIARFQSSVIPFKQPLVAIAHLKLQKDKILIQNTQAKLGKIVTLIQGEYNWNTGSNLMLDIQSLSWENLRQILPVSSTLPLTGELNAKLHLIGTYVNPLLIGTISNTQILKVSQTQIPHLKADFWTNFDKLYLKKLSIKTREGGIMNAFGQAYPKMLESFKQDRVVKFKSIPFEITFSSQLPLQSSMNTYFPIASNIHWGQFNSQGKIQGRWDNLNGAIAWQIASPLNASNRNLSGKGKIVLQGSNLFVKNTNLAVDRGEVILNGKGNLLTKNWQTDLVIKRLALLPLLASKCDEIPWICRQNLSLEQGAIALTGNFAKVTLNTIQGKANFTLASDKDKVAINSRWSKGNIVASALLSQVAFNSKIPNLSMPIILDRGEINLTGSINSLVSLLGKTPNTSDLVASANATFTVADGTILTKGKLDRGIVSTHGKSTPLDLTQLVPNTPTSIKLVDAQFNLTGKLQSLLSSSKRQLNLTGFKGNTNFKLKAADGNIIISNQLTDNLLKTSLGLSDLNLATIQSDLFTRFFKPNFQPLLNAQLNLTQNLVSILNPDIPISIQANSLSLQLGKQRLKGQGTLSVSNLLSSPNITSLNLAVDANTDFSDLSFNSLLSQIPVKRQLLPETIEVTGNGRFQGRLVGRSLFNKTKRISSPPVPSASPAPPAPYLLPSSLQLVGDLNLNQFSINDRSFEPFLTGKLNVRPGERISLDLKGKKDIIAALWTPCSRCYLPYIPQFFELQQVTAVASPVIIQGKRQGEIFTAKINNFPLDWLKIAPISNYNFPDYLSGQLTANLNLNLVTKNGDGFLAVANPNLGKIVANHFQSAWNYQNTRLQFSEAFLQMGKSRYGVSGKVDFLTQEIQGQMEIADGEMQDILTTLQISDIDSLLRFLRVKPNNWASAEQVQPQARGNINASLFQQLQQLWEGDRAIEKLARERQRGILPNSPNIRGQFDAKILLAGTLQTPQLNLLLEGKNWQWSPQGATPSIVSPLGLVAEEVQVIPIEQISIQGKLEKGKIQLHPRLKSNATLWEANITLSRQGSQYVFADSFLELQNLPLEFLKHFAPLPLDVAGTINLHANLTGELLEPTLDGTVGLSEVAINARAIEQDLAGNFTYADTRLQLQVTASELLQFAVNLPYPIQPNVSDRFAVTAQLRTEAFYWLNLLTEERIVWEGGEGELSVNATGQLALKEGLKITLDPVSEIVLTLQEATLRSAVLDSVVLLNGQIKLQSQSLQVPQLMGWMEGRSFLAAGELPLVAAANVASPLTVTLEQVSGKQLYDGMANAHLIITGSAIAPVIEGEFRLSQGTVTVPEVTPKKLPSPAFQQWFGAIAPPKIPVKPPQLADFRVILEDVTLERQTASPKLSVDLQGELVLNGQLDSLLAIRPEGRIEITGGKVDIFPTSVFFSRQAPNTLTFVPNEGLFNPFLDLNLKLYLYSLALTSVNDNEILDDIVKSGRAKASAVNLDIRGEAGQLVPSLGRNVAVLCQLRSPNARPIPLSSSIPPTTLRQLTECIETNAQESLSLADLLRSPIVTVSSSPPLTQNELLTLFGSQFPEMLERLQQQNSSQLVEIGIPQIAVFVFPFVQDWVFEINEETTHWGKILAVPNLRLYPVIETTYPVERDSFVRLSYDYFFNEVTIRYETRF